MQIAAPVPRPVRRLLLAHSPGSKPLLLGLLLLAVFAGAGIVIYQRFFAPAPPAPVGQIVPVQRNNVAATVSATGSIVATKQAKLVFTNSGHIKDILVNVGDQVTAGQALARLVSDSTQVKLDTARSQLTTAQLKLQQLTETATPEAMVVSVLGGAIGIAIGGGLAAVISQVQVPGNGGGAPTNLQTQVGLDSVMLAFFVSAAIGLFFGIYPATRASRLNPIEALRYE
jgi:multidrug efflux pump subunit AcrA (membrane-fusion protein)